MKHRFRVKHHVAPNNAFNDVDAASSPNVAGFKQAFDELNLVILEGKALRLFEACDLGGTGTIGISELEVALMIHDVVPTTSYVTPVDSFNVFDVDGGGDISWVEFKVRVPAITLDAARSSWAKG